MQTRPSSNPSEILVLTQRVRNTIALGESHFREFKSAWEGPPGLKQPRSVKKVCEDIAEGLIAFANADSGELLVGVEDDGTVSGVPYVAAEIQALLNAPRTHILDGQTLPLLSAAQLPLDGKTVIFFSVAKGTTEVYQLAGGSCKQRQGKATLPASARQIQFDRAEVRSREYDREFVDGATVNDLDLRLLQNAADLYIKGLGIEYYLQQVGLAEYGQGGLRIRRAALLLYAKDIQRWQPHSQVRILKVAGTELKSGELYNVTLDEIVVGNISTLLVSGWQTIRPFLAYKTDFGPDARFEQKYIYPELACQEALVNAIAHRDYTSSSGIEVYIYDDRLEIKNPGSLLSTLSLGDLKGLKGVHESRNALVARILRENNRVMRELGEGMKRMFDLMFENELKEPVLCSERGYFSITLNSRSAFSNQQEQWLLMFQQFNLTRLQKRILVAGMGDRELSSEDIYRAMGTNDRDTYDREVTNLRVAGLLEATRSFQIAKVLAEKQNLSKRRIPRFKVCIPGVDTAQENVCKSDPKAGRARPTPAKKAPVPTIIASSEDAFVSGPLNSLWVCDTTSKLSHSEIMAHLGGNAGVLQIRRGSSHSGETVLLLRYANEAQAQETFERLKCSVAKGKLKAELRTWGPV